MRQLQPECRKTKFRRLRLRIHPTRRRRAEDAADVTSSIGIPVYFSGKECHDYDFEIKKDGPVVDIVQVMFHPALHLLEGVGVAAVAVDLSPTSNARLDVVPTRK